VPSAGLPKSVVDGVRDMMLRNLSRKEWMAIKAAIQEICAAEGVAEKDGNAHEL